MNVLLNTGNAANTMEIQKDVDEEEKLVADSDFKQEEVT
jgi:hypothetical protein